MGLFIDFIQDTNNTTFTAIQQSVVNNEAYDPYSGDLKTLATWLDEESYQAVVEADNVNLVLSPRVHLYKRYAYEKLGQDKEAYYEWVLAEKIIEGIKATGAGTAESPYRVTRVSDEHDMLWFLEEELDKQQLVHQDGRSLDVIYCKSGKQIYFDISQPYQRLQTTLK